ncbi:MAG: transposase [Verrucomicrobia bacterium]|nr:MAG: transposase [Verrucomicrobiota bacterium]
MSPHSTAQQGFVLVLVLRKIRGGVEWSVLHRGGVGSPCCHIRFALEAAAARLPGMARSLRIQYPGAIYHVMNRGDQREDIFEDDTDRKSFLNTLGQACEKTGWQVHAYCLLRNHFHLVVETPQPNLSDGMKWLLQTYTGRFNRRHQFFGHVFSGRFKALLVDGSGNGYLRTVSEYVHLNPVRANLIGEDQRLSTYSWSSYPAYLRAQRAPWLRVDRVLGEFGIPRDTPAGRRQFERVMEKRRYEADGKEYKGLERGWCFGAEEFRQELLAQVRDRIGPNHFGQERRELAEERARRIITETLSDGRLTPEQLQMLPANAEIKVQLARRLRRETTMSLKWIAEQLGVGSWKYLSNLLGQPLPNRTQAELF